MSQGKTFVRLGARLLFATMFVVPSFARAEHPAVDCAAEKLPREPAALEAYIGEWPFPARCTEVVESGRYNDLTIGDDKGKTLDALVALNVRSLRLLPRDERNVPANDPVVPTVFASEPGLLVWSHHIPLPLRLEFSGNDLVRVYDGAPELDELRAKLTPGDSRADVFSTLSTDAERLALTVGAFVLGGDRVTIPTNDADKTRTTGCNNWQFDGLATNCPFEPFYSRVRLSFRDNQLVRIEHFCFPVELP